MQGRNGTDHPGKNKITSNFSELFETKKDTESKNQGELGHPAGNQKDKPTRYEQQKMHSTKN